MEKLAGRTPKSGINIIVGLKNMSYFYFACMPINMAILNLEKLTMGQQNYFFAHPEFRMNRESCRTLETKSEIDCYFKNMRMYELSPERLSHDLSFAIKGRNGSPEDFCPALLIDFNEKTIYYSDPIYKKHENYLPENFKLVRQNFLDLVPTKYQFWKIM